jgi:uncharacterized protein YndB with AHSA1/START domain
MSTLKNLPSTNVEMLIRRPVEEVFQAFIDPSITTKFWFTKSSGRLETGKKVYWEWEMFGVSGGVVVKEIEKNKRILVEFDDSTKVEWIFDARAENETNVSISNTGFQGDADEMVRQAIDSMGGFTIVLCGLKALLEHGIVLNLVADRFPDANIEN